MSLFPGAEVGVALRWGSAWPGCGDLWSGRLPVPLLSVLAGVGRSVQLVVW